MPSRRHALTSCSGVRARKSSSYIYVAWRNSVNVDISFRERSGQTDEISFDAIAPQVLDNLESKIDQAGRKADDIDVAPSDSPGAVRAQVLVFPRHRLLSGGRVRFGSCQRKFRDGQGEPDDVRASARHADFRGGKAGDHFVESAKEATSAWGFQTCRFTSILTYLPPAAIMSRDLPRTMWDSKIVPLRCRS